MRFFCKKKEKMIGALIGAATSIASGIAGGIKARKAAKKAGAQLDKMEKENQQWYDREYNKDYMQSALAQSALEKAKETMQDQVRAAQGSSIVTGATGEEAARAKAAANDVVSDTLSNIVQEGEQRRQNVESRYLDTKDSIGNQRVGMYTQQAQNAQNAASQGISSGMGLAGADIQSKLGTGAGLFKNLFGKK